MFSKVNSAIFVATSIFLVGPEPTNKLRIEQVVSRVRRKMDVLLGGQPSIKAVTRLGYKLFVPVMIE